MRLPWRKDPKRSSIDTWLTDYLIPAVESGMFSYNGTTYPFGLNTTYQGQRIQEVANTLPGHMAALRSSPPAFAAQAFRARVLSQVRFKFRNRNTGKIFGTRGLDLLENPWTGGTTGELVSRLEWHEGLAGSAYATRRGNGVRIMRPDWVGLLYGSEMASDDMPAELLGHMLDAELLGYVYQVGGIGNGKSEPVLLLPDEVAHWSSPIPDPESPRAGLSWITPALKDIQGDKAASQHKTLFFANGATPNLVVKGITAASKEQFDEIVDMLEERHKGLGNAYKTLYLTAGADAQVVGADLKQIDFSETVAAGEARIAMVGSVPAALLGALKGLEGSTLNAGNFGAARTLFADTWVKPSLQDLAASLAPIVDVPADAEMWFDPSDIALLHEDAKAAAEIEDLKAQTITTYVKEGFTWESAIAAVNAQDSTLLTHTGLVSVQLQEPGAQPAGQNPPPGGSDAGT